LNAFRLTLRKLRLFALDTRDLLARARPPMTPSRLQVLRVGGFDFHEVGRHIADLAIQQGGLQPHERIVDAGCGIGRLAVPLTSYLTTGGYDGFDIDRSAIRWCRKEITPRFPNFRFTLVDVYNHHYNPRGTIRPERFEFPYDDASADLVVAASLFTHLTPTAATNYAANVARILKAGGRCLASFFLLNADSRAILGDPRTIPKFVDDRGDHAFASPYDPEEAVAFDERAVVHGFHSRGLEIQRVHYGGWAHRPSAVTFQDLIVAVKRR